MGGASLRYWTGSTGLGLAGTDHQHDSSFDRRSDLFPSRKEANHAQDECEKGNS